MSKPKWQPTPAPPPSPQILHFPLRSRRKHPKKKQHHNKYYCKGRLDSVFDEERVVLLSTCSSTAAEMRERTEEGEGEGGGCVAAMEEKWRFQAEMLRAECNFLRMEKEFALKKLERNRVEMENTLTSALQTLIAGQRKIIEGKKVNGILEEEIEDLGEKLEELKKSWKKKKEYEVRQCSNFDKEACHLQQRLHRLGDECSISRKTKNNSTHVELVREKMEGVSKGMLDRMEEELLGSTDNTYAKLDSLTSTRQPSQELEEHKCSGRCKAIVRKIVEQVRAETEQWSQMQQMLRQVRGEMEQLHASRHFWENQALNFAHQIQSLQSSVEEWKEKAQAFETKVNELQLEKSCMANDGREVTSSSRIMSLAKQIEKEKHVLKEETAKLLKKGDMEVMLLKDLPPSSLGKQLEKEKCTFMYHRQKENERSSKPRTAKRPPFRDIRNTSPF